MNYKLRTLEGPTFMKKLGCSLRIYHTFYDVITVVVAFHLRCLVEVMFDSPKCNGITFLLNKIFNLKSN